MSKRSRHRYAQKTTRRRVAHLQEYTTNPVRNPEEPHRKSSKKHANFTLTSLERQLLDSYRAHLAAAAARLGAIGCWQYRDSVWAEAVRMGQRVADTLHAMVVSYAARFKGEQRQRSMAQRGGRE